jgi:hypothetical protein
MTPSATGTLMPENKEKKELVTPSMIKSAYSSTEVHKRADADADTGGRRLRSVESHVGR